MLPWGLQNAAARASTALYAPKCCAPCAVYTAACLSSCYVCFVCVGGGGRGDGFWGVGGGVTIKGVVFVWHDGDSWGYCPCTAGWNPRCSYCASLERPFLGYFLWLAGNAFVFPPPVLLAFPVGGLQVPLAVRLDDVATAVLNVLSAVHEVLRQAAGEEFATADADGDGWLSEIEFVKWVFGWLTG